MNTTLNTSKTTEPAVSAADQAFREKMIAEALEQDAYEVYQGNATGDTWLEHQRAVKTRETAHARYLDALIAEQAALNG